MKICEILNYYGDESAFLNIASAFTPDGLLKFPLDFAGVRQTSAPRADQPTELVGSDNLNPVMLDTNVRSTPSGRVTDPGVAAARYSPPLEHFQNESP
jgi:hypothetical protein